MKKGKSSKTNKKESSIPTNTKSSETPPKVSIPHADLLKALYWAWDGFDRSLINFFCIWETAESVMKKSDLEGDAIYLGVRNLDWLGTSKRIFDAFAGQPIESNEKFDKYVFEGIPVYIYMFPEDVCIQRCDIVFYAHENFNIPNPYSRFLSLYGNRNS